MFNLKLLDVFLDFLFSFNELTDVLDGILVALQVIWVDLEERDDFEYFSIKDFRIEFQIDCLFFEIFQKHVLTEFLNLLDIVK